MKRVKHYLINLTEEESEMIERIAQDTERKPAELIRILLMKAARQQWASMSALNNEPLQPLKH